MDLYVQKRGGRTLGKEVAASQLLPAALHVKFNATLDNQATVVEILGFMETRYFGPSSTNNPASTATDANFPKGFKGR